ncbi:sigma 54-interacting transcriptional regulator [bacterium]|nr:sigma 54-interacting transcriptional regulator [bacterium]
MSDERSDRLPEREALKAFERAIEARSGHEAAVAAVRLGGVYLESDSYSDALSYLTKAEVGELRKELTDPEAAALFVSIARCHLGLGDYNAARRYCARLDDLDLAEDDGNSWADANVVLARVEIESGRYNEALRAAQKAYDVLRSLPESPALAEAGKMLGIANAELGNVKAARDYFTDYLVTQKRFGDEAGLAAAYNNLGVLAKRSGDLHGALEYIEDALEIDRRLGGAMAIADRLTNLGIILYKLSRWSESEERLNEARDLYSRIGAVRGQVAAETALGNVYRIRREWGEARDLFDRALAASQENGYLRAEALALEFIGHLEMDQGHNEQALRTLNRALGCAYRLASNSDVVSEVLRRRAEVFHMLGRLDEAERDCSDGLKLTREIGDSLEEGATLRVLASICYAKGEKAAAEVLVNRAGEILRRTGESYELARTQLADGIGLREASVGEDIPVDVIEARLSAAAAQFSRLGLPDWVARCELERAKALKSGGQPDRARRWFESARLKFECAHDATGLAEIDAALRELDVALADAGIARRGRYALIAEGYRFLETTEPVPDDLHRYAVEIANVLLVDRLVLFRVLEGGSPSVATSVDRSGGGVAEVSRYARVTLSRRGHSRPLVVSNGHSNDASIPGGVGALALIPAEVGLEGGRTYLVYADRSTTDRSVAFTQSDVEFIGAAGRLLGLTHSRIGDALAWQTSGDEVEKLVDSAFEIGMVTRSPQMVSILATVDQLKDSHVPVLIRGESGVGKELIARAIHASGRSSTGRFVALNAGAIAAHLQESELFGHVRGAFTDADRDREGVIEAAADGTLFLDEVGEMSKELQVKLLRFLQNGEYRRVGESVTRKSNARIVSATNKDLRSEVRSGLFRRDLFYRLCTVTVEVPPLRDRSEDIPPLMEHFLEKYSKREGKRISGFSREVKDFFIRYDWHENNVRELENEIRRGVALAKDGDVIGIDKLRPELRSRADVGFVPKGDEPRSRSLKDEVGALERSRILDSLERTGWNKQRAAELLGLSRTGLHAKMKKYGIG